MVRCLGLRVFVSGLRIEGFKMVWLNSKNHADKLSGPKSVALVMSGKTLMLTLRLAAITMQAQVKITRHGSRGRLLCEKQVTM